MSKEPSEASPPPQQPNGGASAGEREASGGGLDHELLSLRGPRPRVGVVLSFSIALLCAYLMVRIVPDVRFALEDDTPARANDAQALVDMQPNSYVEIDSLRLDRAAAVRISHNPDPAMREGKRLAPASGTGASLWVAEGGRAADEPIRRGQGYAGRLRALSEVPFADALTEYAQNEGAPRFTTAEALADALARGQSEVDSPAGEPLPLEPDTPVAVSVVSPGESEITVVATDELPSAESWAQALARADALPGLRPPVAAGDDRWVFAAQNEADPLNAKLADAGLFGAHAEPRERALEARVAELDAGADRVAVAGEEVAWEAIDGVWIEAAASVPDDALLLLAGESPRDYRHALWAFGILGTFALLFGYLLAHGLRRELARPARLAQTEARTNQTGAADDADAGATAPADTDAADGESGTSEP